jgi:hypothetical protein
MLDKLCWRRGGTALLGSELRVSPPGLASCRSRSVNALMISLASKARFRLPTVTWDSAPASVSRAMASLVCGKLRFISSAAHQDSVGGQVIVEANCVGHHEVRNVASAVLVAFDRVMCSSPASRWRITNPTGPPLAEVTDIPRIPWQKRNAREMSLTANRGGDAPEVDPGAIWGAVGHLAP